MQPSELFVAFVGPFYELSLVPLEHFSEPSPILPGPFSELLLVPLGLFHFSLFLPGVSSEFSHVLPWLPSVLFNQSFQRLLLSFLQFLQSSTGFSLLFPTTSVRSPVAPELSMGLSPLPHAPSIEF